MPVAIPQQKLMMAKMLWFVFLSSVGMLAAVLFLAELPAQPAPPTVITVLQILAGVEVLTSILLRRFLMDEKFVRSPERWLQAHIIPYVINESVAIFGFVAALLAGEPRMALPFFAASLALTLGMYPKTPI